MNRLKFILAYKSLSVATSSRQIQTYSVLLARRKHKTIDIQGDPGIQHKKKTFEYDEEHLEQLNDGDDFDDDVDDFDLEHLRNSREEHLREEKWKKKILARQIAKKHFFEPKLQPRMLTWTEKSCMKYLHKKDPLQWSVHALAESFPATPEIVQKVLKANYDRPSEKKEKQDLKVRENWKLLAENKLEGDPEFLEHCKKFVNNRDVILDNIENSNFYLSEKKEEKVYNCGEMSSIIDNYIREIDRKLLADEIASKVDKGTENVKQIESKSSLELLHEKIDEEKAILDLEGKESFKLNMDSENSKKHFTYELFENSVIEKAEKGQNLNLLEKAVLEKRLSNNYLKRNKSDNKIKFNQLNEDIPKKNKSKDFKTSRNDSDFYQRSSFKGRQLPEEDEEEVEEEDESTIMDKNILSGENLGKVLHVDENTVKFKKCEEKSEVKKMKTVESKSVSKDRLNENKRIDNYITNGDDKFGIEDDTILKTGDTNRVESGQSLESVEKLKKGDSENHIKCSHEKDEKVSEDLVLQYKSNFGTGQVEGKETEGRNSAPEIYSKVPKCSISKSLKEVEFEDDYPEKITIPEEKRNLGSIFKVRDCYYDTDGRFLYRVPGITK